MNRAWSHQRKRSSINDSCLIQGHVFRTLIGTKSKSGGLRSASSIAVIPSDHLDESHRKHLIQL